MDTLAKLETHEAIRTVKARYCRYLDTKDWEGLASIFTEDMVLDVQEDSGMPPFEGRAAALETIRWSVQDAKTAHQIHFSEIELNGDEAFVITPMEDRVVWAPGKSPVPGVASITGFGHYHERYVREGGVWKIAHLKLTRLHVDKQPEPAAG
jgi:ketosteroid isomerase-like protein